MPSTPDTTVGPRSRAHRAPVSMLGALVPDHPPGRGKGGIVFEILLRWLDWLFPPGSETSNLCELPESCGDLRPGMDPNG
jgi:hypothetical protein